MSTPILNLTDREKPEINFAIAGMGKMGHFHLAALNQLAAGQDEVYYKARVNELLKKIRICGLSDPDPARTGGHDGILVFASFDELLKACRPDMAVIASPTQSHFQLAKTCLENGVHTLVEKPLVTSRRELDELIRISGVHGCRLISGHVERYNPVSVKIVSLLHEEPEGTESYAFTRTQQYHSRIPDDIIIDKVIHDLDLALYFFGSIASVRVLEIKRRDGRPFEAQISICHKNGTEGTIFVSWIAEPGIKKRLVQIIRNGQKWAGDFAAKRFWIDSQEIRCEVDGMVRPDNNQIKDELVDFISWSVKPHSKAKPVKPLLSMAEIVESIALIEEIKTQVESGF